MSAPLPQRIAIAARNCIVRAGIVAMIQEKKLGRVTGSHATLNQAATTRGADVVLFELELLDMSSSATAPLRAKRGLRYAAFSRNPSVALPAALEDQLDAAMLVDGEADELARGLKALARGERYRSPIFITRASELSMIDARNWELGTIAVLEIVEHGITLTPRERDILRLVTTGAKSEAIAAELGLAVATVRKHRENLRTKLKGHNTAQLTATAIALHLLDDRQMQARRLPLRS